MSHYHEESFTVRKPAWHGLATVLDDYPGREEAMKLFTGQAESTATVTSNRAYILGKDNERNAAGVHPIKRLNQKRAHKATSQALPTKVRANDAMPEP